MTDVCGLKLDHPDEPGVSILPSTPAQHPRTLLPLLHWSDKRLLGATCEYCGEVGPLLSGNSFVNVLIDGSCAGRAGSRWPWFVGEVTGLCRRSSQMRVELWAAAMAASWSRRALADASICTDDNVAGSLSHTAARSGRPDFVVSSCPSV